MHNPNPHDLTPRQLEILAVIRSALESEGRPPTRAEVCQAFGFRSPNAAESHLRALAAKGAIGLEDGRARGIRLPGGLEGLMQREAPTGLPLIGHVAAGSPILAVEHIEGHHPVEPALFSPRADYLLRVRGLSMRDAGILDGDAIAVFGLFHEMGRDDDGDAPLRKTGDGAPESATGQRVDAAGRLSPDQAGPPLAQLQCSLSEERAKKINSLI